MSIQKCLQIRTLSKINQLSPGPLVNITVCSFQEMKSEIFLQLGISDNLDFYNLNGFQLFEDDFPSIVNKDIIYVTIEGQEFPFNEYIKEFEIIQEIGRGGFGIIFLVSHIITKEYRAIKKIPKKNINLNAENKHIDIMNEAKTIQKLNHPNIIKIYNAFCYRSYLYLFLEYIKAGDLGKFLHKHGLFNESQAKIIFTQLLNAIHYCHDHKIVHRDLKLENILITNESNLSIKIIDFGISGFVDEISDAGTLRFLPLEVA